MFRSTNCSWLISPPIGDVVTSNSYTALLISSLDLYDSGDVVTVYDGSSANSAVLARFAGPQATIPYVYSSGVPMFVTFSSNRDYAGRGFAANYYTSPYLSHIYKLSWTLTTSDSVTEV